MPIQLPIIDSLLTTGLKLVDKFIPDPQAKAELQLKLQQLAQEDRRLELEAEIKLLLAQAEISKKEAEHPSIFVAGARPFIVWILGFGLAFEYVIYPLARIFDQSLVSSLDVTNLIILLGGVLGLSVNRSWDKLKGIDTKHISPTKRKKES